VSQLAASELPRLGSSAGRRTLRLAAAGAPGMGRARADCIRNRDLR
jgi:hypothetical protein